MLLGSGQAELLRLGTAAKAEMPRQRNAWNAWNAWVQSYESSLELWNRNHCNHALSTVGPCLSCLCRVFAGSGEPDMWKEPSKELQIGFSISFPYLSSACSQNFFRARSPLVSSGLLTVPWCHRQEELAAAAAEMDDMVAALQELRYCKNGKIREVWCILPGSARQNAAMVEHPRTQCETLVS